MLRSPLFAYPTCGSILIMLPFPSFYLLSFIFSYLSGKRLVIDPHINLIPSSHSLIGRIVR